MCFLLETPVSSVHLLSVHLPDCLFAPVSHLFRRVFKSVFFLLFLLDLLLYYPSYWLGVLPLVGLLISPLQHFLWFLEIIDFWTSKTMRKTFTALEFSSLLYPYYKLVKKTLEHLLQSTFLPDNN